MKSRYFFILFLTLTIIFSCKKENIETISVEGVVTDDASNQPLPGMFISIDGIKSPSGMGLITDGKRETVGRQQQL